MPTLLFSLVFSLTPIQKSIDAAQPGQTITIEPGTYYERVTIAPDLTRGIIRSGTADNPITIIGTGVTVSGDRFLLPRSRSCFEIRDVSYIKLKGFICEGATSYNVLISTGAHHIDVEDCWFRDSKGIAAVGLRINSGTTIDVDPLSLDKDGKPIPGYICKGDVPSDIKVRRCKASRNGAAGIVIGVNSAARAFDVLVEDCDAWGNGVDHTEAGEGIAATYGTTGYNGGTLTPTSRITFRRCLSYNNISSNLVFQEVRDSVMEDCISWGATLTGNADGRGVVVGLHKYGQGTIRRVVSFNNAKAGFYSEHAPGAKFLGCTALWNGFGEGANIPAGFVLDEGECGSCLSYGNIRDGRYLGGGCKLVLNHFADKSLTGTSGDPNLIGTREVIERAARAYERGELERDAFLKTVFTLVKRGR
jgi:hypothetical protein